MSMEQMVPFIVLLGLLGIAVVSDLRRHRIPNLLIVLGLALGLLMTVLMGLSVWAGHALAAQSTMVWLSSGIGMFVVGATLKLVTGNSS